MCPSSAASASFGAFAPYAAFAPCGALYHETVKKKSTFQLRKLPPDLLGRVNAYVELLGVDREKFFEDMLDDMTKELKSVQQSVRKSYDARKVKTKTE